MERYLKKPLRNFFIISFLSFIFFLNPSLAQEEEPIIVNGDRVEYLYEEKKVVGINNVVITYKDVILTCDKIVVYMDTKEAIAEGNVVLTHDKSTFKGEEVHYNFETMKGTIIKAEARSWPWYGKGQTASKVEEKKYLIERGYLTSCDLPHPHYRLQARRVKIYIDDRVEASHLLFFIGEVPLFYFPYYIHPLKDRRPRVTIVPGRDSRWGYYLLTAWRYYLHEWSRGYIHLDWREKKGFGEGIDYKYKAGYFGKGLLRLYHTYETHFITTEEIESTEAGQEVDENRWRLQWRHRWQLDKDTTALAEYHKLSDKFFLKDYYYRDEYERDLQQQTYLSLIRARPGYNLSLYLTARTNRFFTEIERLPELKMEIKNQRLRDTNFYYKSTTSFVMLQKKFEDILINRKDREYWGGEKLKANRFDTDHEFSYLTKLFGFLTFTPFVGLDEAWYSEGRTRNESLFRTSPKVGASLSTKFYRIFSAKTDILGLDINDLRHIITPSATHTYRPTPNIKSTDLKEFDEIDTLGYTNNIALSVVNRLQTKRGELEGEIVNLARLTTTSGVALHPKIVEDDERTLDDYIDDVVFDLELSPYPWLFIGANSIYSTKKNKENGIETINVDAVIQKEEIGRIGFVYRFEQGYDLNGDVDDSKSNTQIIGDFTWNLSPKWSLSAYHRYKKDVDKQNFTLEDQTYSIVRDLHCWLAELSYQVKRTEGLEVDIDHRVGLVMRMKAFPELPFKLFRATYSNTPRAGIESKRSTWYSP